MIELEAMGGKDMLSNTIRLFLIFLLNVFLYAVFPTLVILFPHSLGYYEDLLDLWILNPLISVLFSVVYCGKDGFTYYLPLIAGFSFIVNMMIFYDLSVFPFLIGYIVCSLSGCFIGQKVYEEHIREDY